MGTERYYLATNTRYVDMSSVLLTNSFHLSMLIENLWGLFSWQRKLEIIEIWARVFEYWQKNNLFNEGNTYKEMSMEEMCAEDRNKMGDESPIWKLVQVMTDSVKWVRLQVIIKDVSGWSVRV